MRSLLLSIVAALAALFAALPAAAAAPQSVVLAGGCFWCMEHDMKTYGVVSVQSGYIGGSARDATYERVSSERTGHYEAVKVTYDPDKTTLAVLLDRYWKLTDPTDLGGQFCDRGPSYRPAVFVSNDAQRRIAEQTRAKAAARLKQGEMRTPILARTAFYPAEPYHRDYARKNALQYKLYRAGCGRDARLKAVWGAPAAAGGVAAAEVNSSKPWWRPW